MCIVAKCQCLVGGPAFEAIEKALLVRQQQRGALSKQAQATAATLKTLKNPAVGNLLSSTSYFATHTLKPSKAVGGVDKVAK